MEFQVGENVKFLASGRFDYGNESKIVKITKTQIHIEYKNGNSTVNGTIKKFNSTTLKEIGMGRATPDMIQKL